jgi:hypothetical protein
MAANDQSAPDFPDPLKHFGGDFKGFTLVPSNIDIIETKRDCLAPSGRTLDVLLPALKPRAIDPDFIDTDGEIKILSEVDPHFRKLLSQQRVIQLRNYVAQIYLKPSAIEDSRKRAGEINASWRKLLERDRLSDERLRALIQISGNLAVTQYMPPGTIQYHF